MSSKNVFSTCAAWLQVNGTSEALTSTIKATITVLTNKGREFKTVGTVLAKSGCWSFLKGGFVLENEPIDSLSSRLYFEVSAYLSQTYCALKTI